MDRVGLGYDVHQLVAGRDLILLGVKIPHETGLLGHSDADVAAHAVIDALLGAAGLGDIGEMFPDTDPRYAGADSMFLLREAWQRVQAQGYTFGNLDVNIIAQRPKLLPFKEDMRQKLAAVLDVAPDFVNIKAKTNEKLGYLGRGEAIEAQAIVLLQGK